MLEIVADELELPPGELSGVGAGSLAGCGISGER
jgi:hypothetical protein